MIARTHINLPVSNLDESVNFYSNVFGAKPTKLKSDYANFRLEYPVALHLALVLTPGMPKKYFENTNGQHFGIELFEDSQLEEWKSTVKNSGILPHIEEEDVTCCYAVSNKFWLEDPDGNQWEFWVRSDDEGKSLFSDSDGACCADKEEALVNSCRDSQSSSSCCP